MFHICQASRDGSFFILLWNMIMWSIRVINIIVQLYTEGKKKDVCD